MSIKHITMDLLVKSIIVVIVVVAIFGAVFYLFSSGLLSQQITQAQATSLVYHDLQNTDPGAQVNITNVTPSQYAGSWHILASVILNATSPCPSYFIYSFDYPKYGFVYRIENTYTDDTTIIGSGPAAITWSYEENIPAVTSFVSKYGYSNVAVYATYHKSINYSGLNYSDMWLVEYTAPSANATLNVLISQLNGTSVS